MDVEISYPLRFTGERLGRAVYPLKSGRIRIYLADVAAYAKGDVKKIAREISLTIIEELTHIFAGRTRIDHDYASVLESLPT